MQIKRQWESFFGAPVVKGPPANAGDTVWSLVWEDPTAMEQLSLWPATPEPTRGNYWSPQQRAMLHNTRSHNNEKPTYHSEEQPQLAVTRESPGSAAKTQSSSAPPKFMGPPKPAMRYFLFPRLPAILRLKIPNVGKKCGPLECSYAVNGKFIGDFLES